MTDLVQSITLLILAGYVVFQTRVNHNLDRAMVRMIDLMLNTHGQGIDRQMTGDRCQWPVKRGGLRDACGLPLVAGVCRAHGAAR